MYIPVWGRTFWKILITIPIAFWILKCVGLSYVWWGSEWQLLILHCNNTHLQNKKCWITVMWMKDVPPSLKIYSRTSDLTFHKKGQDINLWLPVIHVESTCIFSSNIRIYRQRKKKLPKLWQGQKKVSFQFVNPKNSSFIGNSLQINMLKETKLSLMFFFAWSFHMNMCMMSLLMVFDMCHHVGKNYLIENLYNVNFTLQNEYLRECLDYRNTGNSETMNN